MRDREPGGAKHKLWSKVSPFFAFYIRIGYVLQRQSCRAIRWLLSAGWALVASPASGSIKNFRTSHAWSMTDERVVEQVRHK